MTVYGEPPLKFTAWDTCPACGRHTVHDLRDPRPAPSPEELEAFRVAWEKWRAEGFEVVEERNVAGDVINAFTIPESPRMPKDESAFEVVRICRCGHEWGMV